MTKYKRESSYPCPVCLPPNSHFSKTTSSFFGCLPLFFAVSTHRMLSKFFFSVLDLLWKTMWSLPYYTAVSFLFSQWSCHAFSFSIFSRAEAPPMYGKQHFLLFCFLFFLELVIVSVLVFSINYHHWFISSLSNWAPNHLSYLWAQQAFHRIPFVLRHSFWILPLLLDAAPQSAVKWPCGDFFCTLSLGTPFSFRDPLGGPLGDPVSSGRRSYIKLYKKS